MENRQKYTLRIACVPSNAVEGVTYMDLKAVQDEIKKAQGDYDYARFECINQDDSPVDVVIKAADIQVIMHHRFQPAVRSQIAVPTIGQPRPSIVQ